MISHGDGKRNFRLRKDGGDSLPGLTRRRIGHDIAGQNSQMRVFGIEYMLDGRNGRRAVRRAMAPMQVGKLCDAEASRFIETKRNRLVFGLQCPSIYA